MDDSKLVGELTDMFIMFQWRLDNPIPSSGETFEDMFRHYNADYLFRGKVLSMVGGVMHLVVKNNYSKEK